VPELLNDELAILVRDRLDVRQPRRLPERFVPPAPDQSHRGRWMAAVVAAFLLGLMLAVLIRPEVGQVVRSGLFGTHPAVTPAPVVTAPTVPSVTRTPGSSPAPSSTAETTPASQPSADGSAPPAGGSSSVVPVPSAPPSGGDAITLPLPPLPLPTPSGGIPVVVPSLPLPPLPLPTSSGGGVPLPPLLPSPRS
jgi:hypothetical protein